MPPLTEEQTRKLIEEATKFRDNAFAPRSSHRIGASVLTTDDNYFGGCNIESI